MAPKSSHHRAKNVGYDDDDGYSDEYYEEEEAGDGILLSSHCISMVQSIDALPGMTDEDRGTTR
jgi:hypothetical protein